MADITRNINYKLNFIPGTMGGIAAGVSGLNQFVDLSNQFFAGLGGINVIDASLVGLAATLLSVQVQAANAFGEFEKGLTSVQAISQELTGNMNTIASASTQLSIQFGKDVNEITAGLETLGRAGLTGLDNQLNTLQEGFNLSTIEGMELNKALETLVQTTTLLGGNMSDLDFSSDVQKINDLLVGTSMAGPLNVSDVAMTLKYAGGTAAIAGANLDDMDLLEDLMGTIATFAQRGVVGDPAGTALRAFLTNPAGANSVTAEGLAKIGLTPDSLWEDGGEKMLPISEQIRIINRAMDKNNLSQQERIEVWSDIVGTKVGQQMLKLDADDIDDATADIQKQASAQQIAEQSMDNLNKKFESLNQAAQALWRSFGESSAKSIGVILDALTGLLEALSNPVLSTLLTMLTTVITTNAVGRGIDLFSRLFSRVGDTNGLISAFYAGPGDATPDALVEQRKRYEDMIKRMENQGDSSTTRNRRNKRNRRNRRTTSNKNNTQDESGKYSKSKSLSYDASVISGELSDIRTIVEKILFSLTGEKVSTSNNQNNNQNNKNYNKNTDPETESIRNQQKIIDKLTNVTNKGKVQYDKKGNPIPDDVEKARLESTKLRDYAIENGYVRPLKNFEKYSNFADYAMKEFDKSKFNFDLGQLYQYGLYGDVLQTALRHTAIAPASAFNGLNAADIANNILREATIKALSGVKGVGETTALNIMKQGMGIGKMMTLSIEGDLEKELMGLKGIGKVIAQNISNSLAQIVADQAKYVKEGQQEISRKHHAALLPEQSSATIPPATGKYDESWSRMYNNHFEARFRDIQQEALNKYGRAPGINLFNEMNSRLTKNLLNSIMPEDVSKALTKEFGSLTSIVRKTEAELMTVPGVTEDLVMSLRKAGEALERLYIQSMTKGLDNLENTNYGYSNTGQKFVQHENDLAKLKAQAEEEARIRQMVQGVNIYRGGMGQLTNPNQSKFKEVGRKVKSVGNVTARAFWHGGMLGDMIQMGEMYAARQGMTGTSKTAKLTKALGAVFSFLGPIEAGLIGVQAAMALYDAKLKEHQEAVADAANALAESVSKYDDSISKIEEAYLEQNPNATDEEVETYITEKEAQIYDNTTGGAIEGDENYIDMSSTDANTYELYKNTLALKENSAKLTKEAENDWFGIGGRLKNIGKSMEVSSEDYIDALENGSNAYAGIYSGLVRADVEDNLEGYSDDALMIATIGADNDEWSGYESNGNIDSMDYMYMGNYIDSIDGLTDETKELTKEYNYTRIRLADTFGWGSTSAKRTLFDENMGVSTNPFYTMNSADVKTLRSTMGSMSGTQSTRIATAMNEHGDELGQLSARIVLRDIQGGGLRKNGEPIDPKTGLRTSGSKKGTPVYDSKTHNEIKAFANKTNLSYTEVLLATQLAQLQQMNAIATNQILPQIMSQVYLAMGNDADNKTANSINSSIAGSNAAISANAAAIASMMGAEVINETSNAFTQMNSKGKDGKGMTPSEYYETYGADDFFKQNFLGPLVEGTYGNLSADYYQDLLSSAENGVEYSDLMRTVKTGMDYRIGVKIEEEYLKQLETLAGANTPQGGTGSGSGDGSGSGSGSDSDKESNKKNYVDLVICNKKTIPKLNVNLFKKEPTFKIQNQNLKLRDIKINTQDKPKAISSAVKNAIIDVQERTNPKIIQDQEAEYNPVEASEGTTTGTDVPTGTSQTN